MAESSLSLGYPELVITVAEFAGWDTDSDNHAADQTAWIERIIDAALRQFYRAHTWNFLKVVAGSLTLEADEYAYDLADDCISIDGDITVPSDANEHNTIKQRSASFIHEKRQRDADGTGFPLYFAIEPKAHAGTTGQRFQAIFWPTVNGDYTARYTYPPLAGQISTSAAYPYGGMLHAETIKAACRAEAERVMFRERGVEWQTYQEELATSRRRDADLSPKNYGPNLDHSDLVAQREAHGGDYTITYS